ncbi:MAG: LytTR family DNA-binding domain-containing protein [Eubacteriales bacterium]|nr:LytTR family DNA-binding domain-containing protein [Eubacteriales bacterium]
MLIALCDDDENYLNCLHRIVTEFFFQKNILLRIDTFLKGEDLLNAGIHYQIYFLDIYLPDISGIEIASRLHENGDHPNIVFTTFSPDHAVEAFSLNAVHYLLKPFSSQSVADALKRCLEHQKKGTEKYLEIKSRQSVIPVPLKNIIYIEVQNKVCTIYTEKSSYQTYASLDSIYEALDDRCFMKPQRSYIVNMNYIEAFYFNQLKLRGGKEIILSRSQRTQLKQQYQSFLFTLAREGEL